VQCDVRALIHLDIDQLLLLLLLLLPSIQTQKPCTMTMINVSAADRGFVVNYR